MDFMNPVNPISPLNPIIPLNPIRPLNPLSPIRNNSKNYERCVPSESNNHCKITGTEIFLLSLGLILSIILGCIIVGLENRRKF